MEIDHSHGHQKPSELPNNIGNQKASGSQQDHEHTHNHQDFGMMGIIAHLISDALNNVGIIVAALVIWKGQFPSRFYSDPIVSLCIAIMILITSLPLCKNAGLILMESVPNGIRLDDIKKDLEKIHDIIAIRDLHVWRLSQEICLASAKVLTKDNSLESFVHSVWQINECLHTHGIQSATIQPILLSEIPETILNLNAKISLKER
ncbi:Zinc/cadmium resistance protein [Golovinomyces cichoracearum]|uniref:Zinc/cadmium resistance protein n=1 Tax=Golovinomyces cichoracearum TaxID=62708 RepID=A0A420I1N5_9PEZI|nr:Zinc/cadmium resistance protein [Golovinomyces cichoracearum]